MPLLPAGVRFNDDDAMQAFERVWTQLITRITGDAWKLTGKVLRSCVRKNTAACWSDRGDAVHLGSLKIS